MLEATSAAKKKAAARMPQQKKARYQVLTLVVA